MFFISLFYALIFTPIIIYFSKWYVPNFEKSLIYEAGSVFDEFNIPYKDDATVNIKTIPLSFNLFVGVFISLFSFSIAYHYIVEHNFTPQAAFFHFTFAVGVTIALIDIYTQWLTEDFTFFFTGLGLVGLAFGWSFTNFNEAILLFIFLNCFGKLLSYFSKGLGLGDVYLIASFGLFFEGYLLLIGIIISSVSFVLIHFVGIISRAFLYKKFWQGMISEYQTQKETPSAFGQYLIAGMFTAFLLKQAGLFTFI